MQYYAVRYAGDVAAGTSDTWQLWTQAQLEGAKDDPRILEEHELINAWQFIRQQEA